MHDPNNYNFCWTEGASGPFEVHGDALSIYRIAIWLSIGKEVKGSIRKGEIQPNKDEFYADIDKIIASRDCLDKKLRSYLELNKERATLP